MAYKDTAATNGAVTLSPGESFTLTVDTELANDIRVSVDDGTGTAPAGYTLLSERYSTSFDEWLFLESRPSNTDRTHSLATAGEQIRVTITRDPALTGTAGYRAELVSRYQSS